MALKLWIQYQLKALLLSLLPLKKRYTLLSPHAFNFVGGR